MFTFSTSNLIKNSTYRTLLLFTFLTLVSTSICEAQSKPSGLRVATAQVITTGSFGTISASRTNGVAPLAVHFSTDFTGDTDQGRGFHTYDYTWNFGDPSSGVWGPNGKSKNTSKGGIAAHVFETAGVYLVTLTIKSLDKTVATKYFHITVEDPDEYYAGIKTICVNNANDSDFSEAPIGALTIRTDTLAEITQYATAGSRILFKRGGSWTVSAELAWPNNPGPVSIGAYGNGLNPNESGIYENNPRISTTSGTFLSFQSKQDWRVYDINFPIGGMGGGAFNLQKHLVLRIQAPTLGWSHWNNDAGLMVIDQMSVVSCEIGDSSGTLVYVGSERLAFLGNIVRNSSDTHVVRVWQAYKSVISHNMISGSSLTNTNGRHALKLHGPGYSTFDNNNEYGPPTPGTSLLGNRTEFVVISDNTFGSSGPWPVAIGPQDGASDDNLSNIIFERNRIISQFGEASSTPVTSSLNIWARYVTIRNNILDGTGSSNSYTGITIRKRGHEPFPLGVEVLNNTIFIPINFTGNNRTGITVGVDAVGTVLKNNLVHITGLTGNILINDLGSQSLQSNNLLNGTINFKDPNNQSPLLRSFELDTDSTDAIDKGLRIEYIFEDFSGKTRPKGSNWDIGAYEYN